MKRAICAAALAVAALISSGCAMCASPYTDAYAAYGGVIERADREQGRVGSAFAPAEAHVLHHGPSPLVAEPWSDDPDAAFWYGDDDSW